MQFRKGPIFVIILLIVFAIGLLSIGFIKPPITVETLEKNITLPLPVKK